MYTRKENREKEAYKELTLPYAKTGNEGQISVIHEDVSDMDDDGFALFVNIAIENDFQETLEFIEALFKAKLNYQNPTSANAELDSEKTETNDEVNRKIRYYNELQNIVTQFKICDKDSVLNVTARQKKEIKEVIENNLLAVEKKVDNFEMKLTKIKKDVWFEQIGQGIVNTRWVRERGAQKKVQEAILNKMKKLPRRQILCTSTSTETTETLPIAKASGSNTPSQNSTVSSSGWQANKQRPSGEIKFMLGRQQPSPDTSTAPSPSGSGTAPSPTPSSGSSTISSPLSVLNVTPVPSSSTWQVNKQRPTGEPQFLLSRKSLHDESKENTTNENQPASEQSSQKKPK